MSKPEKLILIIIAILIGAVIVSQATRYQIRKDCEIVGNNAGQMWRECDL